MPPLEVPDDLAVHVLNFLMSLNWIIIIHLIYFKLTNASFTLIQSTSQTSHYFYSSTSALFLHFGHISTPPNNKINIPFYLQKNLY